MGLCSGGLLVFLVLANIAWSLSKKKCGRRARARAPGPGTYAEEGNETVGVRSARSFNKLAQTGKASFMSTLDRRDRSVVAKGVPAGKYTIEAHNSGASTGKAEPLGTRSARSHNAHVNQGRGTFNSTAQRPASAPRGRAFGGPGEYDAGHLYNCGKTAPAISSSFKSVLPNNAHVRKSATPGVGAYNPSVDCQHDRPPSASFKGPDRNTWSGGKPQTGSLGPGSYELSRGSINHALFDKVKATQRAPPFNSSASRDAYWDE